MSIAGVIDVAILGASGYTALELIKILLRHPRARIVALTTRESGNPSIASLHPSLASRLEMGCEPFDPDTLSRKAQCVFSALPHGASMACVKPLLERKVNVIDLSADYRLRDPKVYAAWYGHAHQDAGNLAHAVYGLPELFGERLKGASLVANPGCYSSSAILGLAPLVSARLVDNKGLIVDSKSGVSGAGRSPKLTTHFPECNESVSSYNVGRHRHTPEIEQILSEVARDAIEVVFTPHLIPMDRGIHGTIYARLNDDLSENRLLEIFREFYQGQPFVRVVDHLPATKDSVDTNFCDLTVRRVGPYALVLSCLDNLVKGAAGAAVQNFNRVFGFAETEGFW